MAVQEFEIYEGLIYKCPPTPKIIRGQEFKKKDQYWRRHTEYEAWEWNDNPKNGYLWWDDPEPGQLEWYYEELERVLHGEWIMIEGKAIFLNNFTYFYHQWFVLKEGDYPEYRDTSLHFLRFIELVFSDPKCRGGNTMKGRRKGVSSMCMSVMLQFGVVLMKNTEQGITSMSNKDAEKIFQLMLINGYSNLPNFFKPRISGNDLPKEKLHIIKKAEGITKEKGIGGSKEGLNNRIEFRAPKANVFDGDGLWILLLDEAGKWEDVKIDSYLVTASQIIHAGKQVGRIIIITTVNRGDKGGDSYKIVWRMSNQSNKNVLGQTENKLYRLFMPGYMGGRDGGWIDKYGNSVWDTPTKEQTEWFKENSPLTIDPYIGCKEYCDLQRKLLASEPEKLQEEIRMFPFTPEEVFNAANDGCYFNIDDINNQISRIESKLEYSSIYRKGLFIKHENGLIEWKDMPHTENDSSNDFRWLILEFPEEQNRNKFTWKNGHKIPLNTDYGSAGADLIVNTEHTAEKGSDASITIFKRYNALDNESNMPIAFGIGRPKSTRQQHEQLFWAMQFYGIKVLIERQPIEWHDFATDNKFLGYCIKTKLKINGQEVYGISSQDGEARNQHLTEMMEYAENNIEKIWYKRILTDMSNFDVKDRTKYDGAMSFGYALMACKEKYRSIIAPENSDQIIRIHNLREKYNKSY